MKRLQTAPVATTATEKTVCIRKSSRASNYFKPTTCNKHWTMCKIGVNRKSSAQPFHPWHRQSLLI